MFSVILKTILGEESKCDECQLYNLEHLVENAK